jgi:glycosyltransferase involved in cell wall biosynthesis
MGRLLYVCEDYVPPATNGSNLVYLACLETLARDHEIFAVMFGDSSRVPRQTDDALKSLCRAHIIVRGVQNSPVLKLLRTLSRALTGKLIAPRFLEERDRGDAYEQIVEFIRIHSPEILYLHKYHCIPRFGSQALNSFKGIRLLDLHDDFVGREAAERRVLKDLLRTFPPLRRYPAYARIRTKHILSKFSEVRSRRQELELLSQFDWLLSASTTEADSYSKLLPGRVLYCPWPIATHSDSNVSRKSRYSAGFIGSDAVFNLEGLLAFVSRILPTIRGKDPAFNFVVAGGISDAFKLAMPDHEDIGVTVMGHLTNVADFYDSVSAVVVPLLNGTGVSLKTLEAAAYHIPVLATPVGARGIPGHKLPSNVLVRNIDEFKEAIRHLPFTPTISQPRTDYAQQFLSTFNGAIAAGINR